MLLSGVDGGGSGSGDGTLTYHSTDENAGKRRRVHPELGCCINMVSNTRTAELGAP
jgi:hypothetical protein